MTKLEYSTQIHRLVALELEAMGESGSRLVSQPYDGAGALLAGRNGGLHPVSLSNEDLQRPEVEQRRLVGVQLTRIP